METLFDAVFLFGQLASVTALVGGALLSLGHRGSLQSLVAPTKTGVQAAPQAAYAS